MTTASIVFLVFVILIAVVAVWLIYRAQRSKKLRSHFGPEYDHAVRELGGRARAENALEARQRRVEKIHVHSLSPLERDRFAGQWHEVQARFVDDPAASIRDADALVCEVMAARGYPMTDFDHRAEDISVDHPQVVRNYRAAHAIATRHTKGPVSTEDLRMALVFYRDLFDELLGSQVEARR